MSVFEKVGLNDLSLPELRELIGGANMRIAELERSAKTDLLSEFRARAEQLGLDFNDFLPASGSSSASPKAAAKAVDGDRKRAPAAIKYRHPDEPNLTWTGRGRQPLWVKAAEDTGYTLADLLVVKAPEAAPEAEAAPKGGKGSRGGKKGSKPANEEGGSSGEADAA